MKSTNRLAPGDIGKIVSDLVPDDILFGVRCLNDWYNSNPYRRFNGNNDDNYGKEMVHDVLVLKNIYSDLADVRPVVIIEGSSSRTLNGKLVYQYDTTMTYDMDKNVDVSQRQRTTSQRSFNKSDIEKYYKKLTTIKDQSPATLSEAITNALNVYDAKIDVNDILLYRDIHYLSHTSGPFWKL